MKKIISLVLVAILCLSVLTGCEAIKGLFGNGGTTVDEGLTDAVTLLHGIYKDKSETTSVDFDVVGQVVVNGVKYPVTWTCDNDKIAIRESTKLGFYTVDLPDVNTEEFTYTLTATISDANGNSQQKSYTFKMLVVNNESVVNELIEGVAYKMFLLQGNKGQRFYALNAATTSENKFINTTVDPKAGAEFYVEKVDGGYKWYTLINDVKTYVYATTSQNGDKISKFIGFSTEEGTVFTYNTDMGGVWTTSINGTTYGVGSYNSFTTISLSEGTFYSVDTIGSTQFVLQFITAEEANKLSPDEEVKIDVPAANSTLTIEEAIALGKLFTKDSYTSGKYYVTGEIVKISSDVYGNMDIKDAEGNTFTIYGTYDATGANRFDAMENQPEVGDTVTVYGIIGFYSAPQMKNGWIVAINGENLGGGNTPSVGDNAVLDLMGNANLVNASGEQNVFAANGITFTNDKASSTSALTVQESYAQRAYAGSTIKIEYTGMTKIVITFDDYSPDGTKNYMSGMDGMVVEGATFSRNNDVLTITFAAPTDVFQSTTLTSQIRIEKIEVYTGDVENGGNQGGGNEGGETPAPSTDAKEILDALYGLADGESLTGSFTLTGKITALDNYSNPTIVVEGFEDKPVYCYKLVVTNVVGDIITVTATSMKNYSGTYEFMNCTLVAAGGDNNEGGENGGNTETPSESETVTIPQANQIASGYSHDTYTTNKYYVTGFITNISNTQYGNMIIADENGNTLTVYGTYDADGTNQYGAMANQPKVGDKITVYGILGTYSNATQMKNGWIVAVEAHTEHVFADATCLAPKTCICGETEGEALGHNFADGKCSLCGCSENKSSVRFDFGENGNAAHADGTAMTTPFESVSDGEKLTITTASKVYSGARDAMGNSCLKLGTSSVTGSFSFNVDSDVKSVVIYVAGYKAATSTNVKINGTQYSVTTSSNNGEYTAIEIDVTGVDTITFETVTYRCMIDAIVFNY